MFCEKFLETLALPGIVAIASSADGKAHVVNTWNNFVQIVDNKLLIPAGGMSATEQNTKGCNYVELTVGSTENKAGFLLCGTAEFFAEGELYDKVKAAQSWASRALVVTVTECKQTM